MTDLPNEPIRRIFTFDGGPASLVTLRVMRTMAEEIPDLLTNVDLFAGVSEGSYAALYLALQTSRGKSAVETIDECIRFLDEFTCAAHASCFGTLRLLSGLGPLDTSEQVLGVLERWFGNATLADIKPCVMTAGFNIDVWRPRLFKNFGPEQAPGKLPLVDMALGGSCYPLLVNTYYLPSDIEGENGGQFVDGAVMINNPTMTAISAALATYRERERGEVETDYRDLGSMRVFSAGGTVPPVSEPGGPFGRIAAKLVDVAGLVLAGGTRAVWGTTMRHNMYWGWIQWMVMHPWMYVNLTLQAPCEQVDFQAQHILGSARYKRFAPKIDEIFAAGQILFKDPQAVIGEAEEAAAALTDPGCTSPECEQVRMITRWLATSWNRTTPP